MKATLCQQLAQLKTRDRLCVISKIEDEIMFVSHIIDEYGCATDVKRFAVCFAPFQTDLGNIIVCYKTKYDVRDSDCPPFPLKILLREAAETDRVKFEAFLWFCERKAAAGYAAAADAVAAAAAAAYAAADAVAAAAAAAYAAADAVAAADAAAAAAAYAAYAAYAAADAVAAADAAAAAAAYAAYAAYAAADAVAGYAAGYAARKQFYSDAYTFLSNYDPARGMRQ